MRFFFTFGFLLLLSSASMAQFAPGVEWEQCIPNASVTAAVTVSDTVFTVLYDLMGCNDSTSIGLRSYNSSGDLLWEKIYSPPDSANYHSFSLAQNNAGKYFITGSMTKQKSAFNLIMTCDNIGNSVAVKLYYFDSVAAPQYSKIIPDNTGGLFFAGETYTNNLRDLLLLRLDQNFNVISQKVIGGSGFENLNDIISSPQGGYLLAGSTTSNDSLFQSNHGRSDIFLLRLSESTSVLWATCYGDSMNEEARSIVAFPYGYVIAGMSQSASGAVHGHHGSINDFDEWIFKVDTSGAMKWNKSFGGSHGDFVSQMELMGDSSMVITGSSYSQDGDVTDHHNTWLSDDQWTMKMKIDSTVVWKKSTGGTWDDWSHCETVLDSSDVIIAGGTLSSDGDHHHSCFSNDCRVINGGWIVKLNEHCPVFPTVQFSFTQTGKEIDFTNQSYNAASYLWDFGDGNTSAAMNPNHTYDYQGNYNVCLTGIDSCSQKTKCVTLNVCTDNLVANFSEQYPDSTIVQFNDQSVNAATWFWDFGDGSTDTIQNPQHIYNQFGNFNVSLIVVDSCNLSRDTIVQTINTCNGFLAYFGYNENFNIVSFSDSTKGSPISWSWFFGDGISSEEQNPVHEYTSGGVYPVCLIASNGICSADTICKLITVSCPPFDAAFSFLTDDNIVQFTDQSVNAIQWSWNFGDGNFSSDENPIHTFDSGGTYLVCLITKDSCAADTICQLLDVECPEFTAAFAFTQAADTVKFTDETVYATQWFWNFDDGNFSTEQNPIHVYSDSGTYTVCLVAYDGCSHDTTCDTVNIYPTSSHTISAGDEFVIFPNPATDLLAVSFSVSTAENVVFDLKDATGRTVMKMADKNFSTGNHLMNLDLSPLSRGIYFIEMKSGKSWITKKIILN